MQTFQPSSMMANPSVLVIGRSGAGKTTLVKRLLDTLTPKPSRHLVFDVGTSFADIAGVETFKEYDDASIEKVLRDATKNEVVIIDNSAFDARICGLKNFRGLSTNTRSFKTSLFVSIPFAMPSSPYTPDYVMVFPEPNASNVKRAYDQYIAPFVPGLSLEAFSETLGKLPAFSCLVIAPASKSVFVL